MSFDYNSVKTSIEGMMDKLEQFLVSKTVVGEQIQVGNAILIPFISLGFGMGAGLGAGQDEKTAGNGGGGGMGASIRPVAVLVIRGENVELLPIKKSSGLEKLVEMVPGILEKVKGDSGKDDGKQEEKKGD